MPSVTLAADWRNSAVIPTNMRKQHTSTIGITCRGTRKALKSGSNTACSGPGKQVGPTWVSSLQNLGRLDKESRKGPHVVYTRLRKSPEEHGSMGAEAREGAEGTLVSETFAEQYTSSLTC